ncbi:MAG TPA: HlyD family secretion protein [Syntrophobacteria bacterium]|nr:HlyD family secretion protein [Syntrophobacteria bacterium]
MEKTPFKSNNQRRNQKLLLVGVIVAVCAAIWLLYWALFGHYRESTDDAYIVADSARISSRVPGTVLRVHAENDQPVAAGQVLLELDPRDYQALVEQAQGALARYEGEVKAQAVTISPTDTQTAAQIQAGTNALQGARDKRQENQFRFEQLERRRVAAQADADKAERDFRRFDALFQSGAASEQQRDNAHTLLVKTKEELNAIDAEMAGVKASIAASDQEVERAQAQLRGTKSDRYRVEAQAYKLAALEGQRQEAAGALEAARLNLSYCTVVASIAGYIAQKNVQVGDRVQPGQPLMAVVPLREAYIEANFKETQLENIRIGQPVTIEADTYSGYTYRGKVVGIRAGTGAAFSLLPPENATGNWIKVVQRVPVKIVLDAPPPPQYPLRVGASLLVTVNTRNRSGAVLVPQITKP